MKYTTLGKTNIKVSKICLGTMTFGEQNTEAEGHEQMDYALDQGVNFFDTAELYAVPSNPKTQGDTERIIGTWFASRKNRDKVVLGTKVTGPSKGLSHIRNPLVFNKEQITTAIEGSLERLQTDYIDLYQLHWPERKTNFFGKLGYQHDETDSWKDNFLEVLETLNDLVKAGKVRHIGISNETPWGMMRVLQLAEKHDLPRVVSIQNPYNLLNRSFEVGLAEMAIRESVGLLAYSPLAFGLLSGKYHKGADNEDSRLNKFKQMSRYNSDLCFEIVKAYVALADQLGITTTQLALAYINTRPFLTSNIIGATTMEQLKENIGTINIDISENVEKAIDKIHHNCPNPAP